MEIESWKPQSSVFGKDLALLSTAGSLEFLNILF